MGKQKHIAATVIDFTACRVHKSDPLSTSVIVHYMRQVEFANFIRTVAQGLYQTLRGWSSRKILSRDLNAMPDYLLRDIGIRREQIPALVVGELRRGSLSFEPDGKPVRPCLLQGHGRDAAGGLIRPGV